MQIRPEGRFENDFMAYLTPFKPEDRFGSLNKTARAVGRLRRRHGNGHTVTGRIDLSDDRGVNNLGSDRSIP
jgi:hypothetical protein